MDDDKKWTAVWLFAGVGSLLVALLVLIGIGVLIGHFAISSSSNSSSNHKNKTTTAVSAAVPSESPTTEWTSVGGSLMHENYSPLSQINTSNVAQLKGVWEKNLGTANTAIYSAEGQTIEHDGIEYISTGSDNIFAYQVTTGKLLWHYAPQPAIPLSYSTAVCCGWDNRGVGIGGGRIYIGQINGEIVALDEKTGNVEWTTSIGTPKNYQTITMPITYYNGRVYAGVSGAEYHVRGFIAAFDASDGQQLWKFWNTAAPNQPNGNTWAGNTATTIAGASTWNAPSVDTKTNTIFYSTGNAGNDYDGRKRPGKNLYTSSILALNASTGKLKWYYQEVHHDIWDYDAPSETVLFNPTINGKVEPAIAQPGKTGMLYVLNRNTGKPLFPTPEKPVIQNAAQHTWPTQPISPLAFSPQKVTAGTMAELEAAAKATGPASAALKLTPGPNFDGNAAVVGGTKVDANPNGASGGDNWQPSSFDPSDDYYYTCSASGAQAFILNPNPNGKSVFPGESGAVSVFAVAGFATPGYVTAFNMNTGKIAWQDKWPTSCYSGTVDTAGGLVFVGQSNGKLLALNAKTGQTLWSFQTGAGANAPVSVFNVNGTEYVSLYAGGNDLAGASHGANYWLFSLKGTLNQVKPGAAAVAGEHGGTAAQLKKLKSTGKKQSGAAKAQSGPSLVAAGKSIFQSTCGGCHKLADAHTAGDEGPDLDQLKPSDATVTHQVINGGGAMPAFGKDKTLSAQQIEEVAKYVSSVAGKS